MLSRNFPGYSEIFKIIPKLPRPSGAFQTIWKLSRLSRNFPDRSETFQTIRKLSRPSVTSQCNFKGYMQKLSGRAKTFRMAMPRCPYGFCASGLLAIWWAESRTQKFNFAHYKKTKVVYFLGPST